MACQVSLPSTSRIRCPPAGRSLAGRTRQAPSIFRWVCTVTPPSTRVSRCLPRLGRFRHLAAGQVGGGVPGHPEVGAGELAAFERLAEPPRCIPDRIPLRHHPSSLPRPQYALAPARFRRASASSAPALPYSARRLGAASARARPSCRRTSRAGAPTVRVPCRGPWPVPGPRAAQRTSRFSLAAPAALAPARAARRTPGPDPSSVAESFMRSGAHEWFNHALLNASSWRWVKDARG